MRIIAGNAGGRRLQSPSSKEIRPTPDRVRESLFGILGNITGAVVVDGFAGTGACGCEALSRGASHCYFIDSADEAISLVEENLQRLGAEERGIILPGTFESQLATIDEDPDLWFLDPPYYEDLSEDSLQAMARASCVTDRALAVLEQDKRDDVPSVAGFELEDNRVYGKTRLLFYRYHEN